MYDIGIPKYFKKGKGGGGTMGGGAQTEMK